MTDEMKDARDEWQRGLQQTMGEVRQISDRADQRYERHVLFWMAVAWFIALIVGGVVGSAAVALALWLLK